MSSLRETTVVVIGASGSGTGFAIAAAGAAVLLGGRSIARLDSAAERIGESVPGAVLTAKAVDVTDPASVAGFLWRSKYASSRDGNR
jgi:NADP-dependent 3-hydroxy acid dehydrogenase YdfG